MSTIVGMMIITPEAISQKFIGTWMSEKEKSFPNVKKDLIQETSAELISYS